MWRGIRVADDAPLKRVFNSLLHPNQSECHGAVINSIIWCVFGFIKQKQKQQKQQQKQKTDTATILPCALKKCSYQAAGL